MRFTALITLWILGFSAYGEKLTYYSPRPQFELERTQALIRLESPQRNLKLTISKCNKPYIDAFWKDVLAEYGKYPSTRGTPKIAYAELDGKRRTIVPGVLKNRMRSLPEKFITLIALDKQKCKS